MYCQLVQNMLYYKAMSGELPGELPQIPKGKSDNPNFDIIRKKHWQVDVRSITVLIDLWNFFSSILDFGDEVMSKRSEEVYNKYKDSMNRDKYLDLYSRETILIQIISSLMNLELIPPNDFEHNVLYNLKKYVEDERKLILLLMDSDKSKEILENASLL